MNAVLDVVGAPKGLQRCGDCPIRERAVCAYSGPTELAFLDSIKSYRTFRPGEEIAAQGERTDFLGSVVSGVVGLTKGLEDGRRQMVGLVFPGDFIGRPMRPIAPYDTFAVSDVKLCIFMRSRFEALLAESPQLERRLLEMTLDELDSARDWMVLLGRKTAREKIASFLLLCARRSVNLRHGEVKDGVEFILPLTREQIADYLGLTIETVSRQISALKKERIIDLVDARTLRLPNARVLHDAASVDD